MKEQYPNGGSNPRSPTMINDGPKTPDRARVRAIDNALTRNHVMLELMPSGADERIRELTEEREELMGLRETWA